LTLWKRTLTVKQITKRSEVIERALAIAAGALPAMPKPGITAADVLAVFPGAKVHLPTTEDLSKPDKCPHCDKEHIPKWRRGGKVVRRTWPDERWEWCCHFCGREVKK
jgi:hypothetical protein